jgi:hypothetical protein
MALILPLKTESTPDGLRAWFAPPGRRFHLIVSLSDGSTHRVDIYRGSPPSQGSGKPKPLKIYPLIAPRGTWT